jgi:hypothetical protein
MNAFRRGLVAGALALLVAGSLAACSDDDDDATVEAVTSTSAAVTSTSVAAAGGGSASGGGGSSSGGQSGGGSGSGSGQSAAPAPVINSFETPESIDCHNGNFQMFTATWTTTNATKTTISIDGGGVYKTYGPDDEASLPFNCSSPHTFVLTAIGADGKTASRSVTLQPRNVQGGPDTTEEEEP